LIQRKREKKKMKIPLLHLFIVCSLVTISASEITPLTKEVGRMTQSMVLVKGNSLALRPKKGGEPLFNLDAITVAFNGINKFIEKIRPSQTGLDSATEGSELDSLVSELRGMKDKLAQYDLEVSYKIECDLAAQIIRSNREKKKLKSYNYNLCSFEVMWAHPQWREFVKQTDVAFRKIPERDSWYLRRDFDELILQLNEIHDVAEAEFSISEKTALVYQANYKSWYELLLSFLF
jgi:hypothetical protein